MPLPEAKAELRMINARLEAAYPYKQPERRSGMARVVGDVPYIMFGVPTCQQREPLVSVLFQETPATAANFLARPVK